MNPNQTAEQWVAEKLENTHPHLPTFSEPHSPYNLKAAEMNLAAFSQAKALCISLRSEVERLEKELAATRAELEAHSAESIKQTLRAETAERTLAALQEQNLALKAKPPGRAINFNGDVYYFTPDGVYKWAGRRGLCWWHELVFRVKAAWRILLKG